MEGARIHVGPTVTLLEEKTSPRSCSPDSTISDPHDFRFDGCGSASSFSSRSQSPDAGEPLSAGPSPLVVSPPLSPALSPVLPSSSLHPAHAQQMPAVALAHKRNSVSVVPHKRSPSGHAHARIVRDRPVTRYTFEIDDGKERKDRDRDRDSRDSKERDAAIGYGLGLGLGSVPVSVSSSSTSAESASTSTARPVRRSSSLTGPQGVKVAKLWGVIPTMPTLSTFGIGIGKTSPSTSTSTSHTTAVAMAESERESKLQLLGKQGSSSSLSLEHTHSPVSSMGRMGVLMAAKKTETKVSTPSSSSSCFLPCFNRKGLGTEDPSDLPEEILLHVLSFCDHSSLCMMSGLNRNFRVLCNTATLWRDVYLAKWKKIHHSDVKYSLCDDWKTILFKREQLERNWREGRAIELEAEGHDKPVVCLHLNKNTVVSGSQDKTLRVWETETGACRFKLEGHTSWIRCLQSDEWKAISGSSDRDIRVWNLKTGQCTATLSAHDGSVWCLEYDDSIVASGAADESVRVWDLGAGLVLRRLQGHIGPVACVRLIGGGLLASGGTDKTVRIWDARSPEQWAVSSMEGHTKRVDGLQIHEHNLITSSRSASEIRIWDTRRWECIKAISTQGLTCMRVSGDRIATGHTDRCVRVHDTRTGELLRTLTGHTDSIQCLQMDRGRIVSGSRDCTVRLWDPESGREMNRIRFFNRGFPSCLSFNQSKLVLGTSANGVLMYDFSLSGRDEDTPCSALCLPLMKGKNRPGRRTIVP